MEMNLARTLRQNRVESTGGETPPPSYEEAEAFDIMSKATTLEVYATHGNKMHYFVQEDPRRRTAHQIMSVEQELARMEMNLASTLRQNRVESTGGETPPPSYEEVEAFDILSNATTLEVFATHGDKMYYFCTRRSQKSYS
ncbi:hypothetical protein CEXT_414251 [Caerostris extrusa]|uniref:Uncharacterized protein n=1 Tax=Caerostris extrusa TaxID=172846 RepID=A0AAV4U4Q9_CAEEX|nr:hypothetical protein CEXT_414251 [Caerostris extrusa]